MSPDHRRWLRPQAVPRGFLRMYLLTLLSRGPESGYSIIQKIDEKTGGAWRPGPGTMYPLLRGLVREGLAKRKDSASKGTKVYTLTPKGAAELQSMQKTIKGMGKKEGVLGNLFADLLPGDVFVSMVVNRFREGSAYFRQKVDEVPEPERTESLKEYRLLLEAQSRWVDEKLSEPPTSVRRKR